MHAHEGGGRAEVRHATVQCTPDRQLQDGSVRKVSRSSLGCKDSAVGGSRTAAATCLVCSGGRLTPVQQLSQAVMTCWHNACCVVAACVEIYPAPLDAVAAEALLTTCCCAAAAMCRSSSACDPHGEVWGVSGLYIADGSAFPTPSGVNPMITIYGLSYLTAQGIAGRWKKQRLNGK